MPDNNRLGQLLEALARVSGHPPSSEANTLGDLGIDSRHLVELMVACDQIYGREVPFEVLDITVETSVLSLHNQIIAL